MPKMLHQKAAIAAFQQEYLAVGRRAKDLCVVQPGPVGPKEILPVAFNDTPRNLLSLEVERGLPLEIAGSEINQHARPFYIWQAPPACG
jgi:hypothetical protein